MSEWLVDALRLPGSPVTNHLPSQPLFACESASRFMSSHPYMRRYIFDHFLLHIPPPPPPKKNVSNFHICLFFFHFFMPVFFFLSLLFILIFFFSLSCIVSVPLVYHLLCS